VLGYGVGCLKMTERTPKEWDYPAKSRKISAKPELAQIISKLTISIIKSANLRASGSLRHGRQQ
jgi:hypothetical protein